MKHATSTLIMLALIGFMASFGIAPQPEFKSGQVHESEQVITSDDVAIVADFDHQVIVTRFSSGPKIGLTEYSQRQCGDTAYAFASTTSSTHPTGQEWNHVDPGSWL